MGDSMMEKQYSTQLVVSYFSFVWSIFQSKKRNACTISIKIEAIKSKVYK